MNEAPGMPRQIARVQAARYVLPLREGGSMPGLIEDSQGRLWVTKLVGAGQGAGALVAELVVGELARALGFPMPELALVEVPVRFGASEGDPEVQELLKASVGTNLGLAFLSGALSYDPSAGFPMDPEFAARLVAVDVALSNVDRTHRNPNLLWVAGKLWLIDHGAALYWQHGWDGGSERALAPLPNLSEHVALPAARDLAGAAAEVARELTRERLEAALALVPDAWFGVDTEPVKRRAAFVARIERRLGALPQLVQPPA